MCFCKRALDDDHSDGSDDCGDRGRRSGDDGQCREGDDDDVVVVVVVV